MSRTLIAPLALCAAFSGTFPVAADATYLHLADARKAADRVVLRMAAGIRKATHYSVPIENCERRSSRVVVCRYEIYAGTITCYGTVKVKRAYKRDNTYLAAYPRSESCS